jgi:hypothetical protein
MAHVQAKADYQSAADYQPDPHFPAAARTGLETVHARSVIQKPSSGARRTKTSFKVCGGIRPILAAWQEYDRQENRSGDLFYY